MNNPIKLLLFNILLCAAPAMQAMGSLRNYGIKAFKKITSATAATVFLTGGIHSVYQQAAHKELTLEEMQANNAKYFAQFSECPHFKIEIARKALQVPTGGFAAHILPMLEALRKHDKKFKKVPLLVSDISEAAANWGCTSCQHNSVVIDPYTFSYMSKKEQKFALAHELGHIAHEHVKIKERKTDWQICHEHECQADEYAARILGTIDGGLEYFHAIQTDDDNFEFDGWSASILNFFSERHSHPSHEKRVEKLLALKKSGALEKKKQVPVFEQIFKKNPQVMNYINT